MLSHTAFARVDSRRFEEDSIVEKVEESLSEKLEASIVEKVEEFLAEKVDDEGEVSAESREGRVV